jgi:EmrB/QacA subfamily drug resistance transporter
MADDAAPSPPRPNDSRLVPLIIGAALFMQTLDGHSIATVLPAAADSFGVTPLSLNLALTVYFAGAAAFLPLSGWFADRYGARRVFQVSIVGFIVGSVICAEAMTPLHLLIGRAVQGVSGSALLPIGRLVLLRTTDKADLIRRLTYLTIPPLLGPLFGPLIGGAAATYGSWRWIFLLNIPIGLIGLALVSRFVPQLREPDLAGFDRIGALLSASGLVALVVLLDQAGRAHRFGVTELGLLLVTLTAAALYLRHYRTSRRPILDLSLVRLPTFLSGTVGGLFFRLSIGAETFLYAMLFQVGMGLSPMASGSLTLVSSLGMLAVRTTSERFLKRFGFKRILVVNAYFCAATLMVPALFARDTPFIVLALVLLVRGFFRSLQLNALNAITYADAPPERMSAASSLAATMQQTAQGLSIAIASSLLASIHELSEASTFRAAGATFVILALISLISIFFFRALPEHAGSDLSGKRDPNEGISD